LVFAFSVDQGPLNHNLIAIKEDEVCFKKNCRLIKSIMLGKERNKIYQYHDILFVVVCRQRKRE
jgi:hypothetical protein